MQTSLTAIHVKIKSPFSVDDAESISVTLALQNIYDLNLELVMTLWTTKARMMTSYVSATCILFMSYLYSVEHVMFPFA